MIDDKYNRNGETKRFILAHSMGGLMAAHFAAMRPQKYFNAMTLMAPYFALRNEENFNKYRIQVQILDKIAPTYKYVPFPVLKGTRYPDHIMHFITEDPMIFSKGKMPVRNVAVPQKLR